MERTKRKGTDCRFPKCGSFVIPYWFFLPFCRNGRRMALQKWQISPFFAVFSVWHALCSLLGVDFKISALLNFE